MQVDRGHLPPERTLLLVGRIEHFLSSPLLEWTKEITRLRRLLEGS